MTGKEKKFCEYFVVCNNATESAIKAGYSKKTARYIACNLKQKPHIQEYIKFLEAERIAELGINKYSYMIEYNNIAKLNIKNYIEFLGNQTYIDENGNTCNEPKFRIKLPSELSDEHASCIKSMKYEKGQFIGYEFWDKTKALNDMLKLLTEIKNDDNEEKLNQEDIIAIEKILNTLNDLNS